jgi:hypothetical protein
MPSELFTSRSSTMIEVPSPTRSYWAAQHCSRPLELGQLKHRRRIVPQLEADYLLETESAFIEGYGTFEALHGTADV